MELLKKNINNAIDKKRDNSDKKELFSKERHPKTAEMYKKEWAFINDSTLRENIAYQMQYLEFLVHLYNDYKIYLTVESLLCKDIIATVGGVIEASLFDLIQSARKKENLDMMERTDFTALLGSAYNEHHLIDRDMWHFCHDLRKLRNLVHLKAADFQEHMAYNVEQANQSIEMLEKFRLSFIQP